MPVEIKNLLTKLFDIIAAIVNTNLGIELL